MRTSILFLFILSLLGSCDSRKSAEEGEIYLQDLRRRKILSSLDDKTYSSDLYSAEYTYRFTTAQLIRLKLLILKDGQNSSLNGQLCDEVEHLAKEINDDSTLTDVRLTLFSQYNALKDTARAEEVLRQLEPSLLQTDPEQLRRLYLGMSVLYADLQRPGEHARWVRRIRPEQEPRDSRYYINISSNFNKLRDYRQALLYADTALMLLKPPYIVSTSHLVKGISLVRLGHITEARNWFDQCIGEVRRFQREKGIKSISVIQAELFYEYASLLKQLGEPLKALPILEDIPGSLQGKQTEIKERKKTLSVMVFRLLSECNRDLSRQPETSRYTRLADSLQTVIKRDQSQAQLSVSQERKYKDQLLLKLAWQEKKATQARIIQYLLGSIALLLTAVILAGYLWWRNRRRRLRQLFDLLTSQHAAWLRVHDPYPLRMAPESLPVVDLSQNENEPSEEEMTVTPENLLRIYQRVSQVMRDRQPYLDPNLDLVSLARLVGTNRTDLSTVLNLQTGMNFSRWLAEYRVNYLLTLVTLNPDKDIADLSTEAGFTSRTSFYRQFRQVTGLTPSQYKNERKQAHQ